MDVLPSILREIERVPDRTAVAVGEEALTYRELGVRSAALAGRLAAAGVGPGQAVVIYQHQRLSVVVGMLAALRLGSPWCFVDVTHPVTNMLALLENVDCGAVVFRGDDLDTPVAKVRESVTGTALIDDSEPFGAAPLDVRHVPDAAPAYLITTSGSTGRPKVVILSRHGLGALVASHDYGRQAAGDVAFSVARFSWDGSLQLTFWALCSGRTAVLPTGAVLSRVDAVAALMRRWRATHAAMTPSFLRLLLAHAEGMDEHLRLIIVGGEPVPVSLVEGHRATLPATALNNEYGPTEVTVGCAVFQVTSVPDGVVPFGRPTTGSFAYVLDERLVPVPLGSTGELYVGGEQVATGYAGQPGATAERFVADPFTATPGARMYRTGDIVCANEAGDLEFHGRFDGQVKVRGVRVERLAVTAALEDHPAVGQAVVLDTVDEHGETTLTAFWTPSPEATVMPSVRELNAFCRRRLVEQATPEVFVAVGRMPLGTTGKVDEAALRALVPSETPAIRRWTRRQLAVAELWTEVLRHNDFDRHDNFFSVGGNSRRVVELHLRMQRRWPDAVTVGQLFDLVTVTQQASALGADAPEERPTVTTFEL